MTVLGLIQELSLASMGPRRVTERRFHLQWLAYLEALVMAHVSFYALTPQDWLGVLQDLQDAVDTEYTALYLAAMTVPTSDPPSMWQGVCVFCCMDCMDAIARKPQKPIVLR